ncbi:chemotaxis protein CheA [Lentibacter algarum]|uniref:chemotaxis protein CheA n=1 Tax=Lentibacter algarum TaxID=576131 RepID=UPI0023F20A2D|nr:chemotaxis protein CheA [Lentibacter algarum]
MVNTNKILTVSYGTFSCTLEGFDDSFGTMKAIAEYFRDLAADDRYFGAEPPSPDAEMLARIAEREISRRVEAHRDENTFVLRADPASLLPMATKPVAKAPEAPAKEMDAPAAAPVADVPATKPEVVRPIKEASPVAEARPETSIAGLSALVAESQASHEADDKLPEPAPRPEPVATTRQATADPDSVAAKLQRIRDVVSKHDGENGYSEDEHAEDFLTEDEEATEEFLSSAQDDIEAALAADAAADAAEAERFEAEEKAKAEAAQAKAEAEAKAKAEAEAKAQAQKAEEDAKAAAAAEAEAEAAEAAQNTPVTTDDEDDIGALLDKLSASDSAGETDPANDAPKPEAFVGDEDGEAPLRARVIKMKKTDFEAALADGLIEEEQDETTASSLSAEDEADLMRELAAVEAEATQGSKSQATRLDEDDEDDDYDSYNEADFDEDEHDEDYDDEALSEAAGADTAGNLFAAEDDATENTVASAVRAVRTARLVEASTDDQMGRILDKTNTKLDEDEGRGRRNAIAHLRAAVQATEAERNMGGDLGADGRDTEVYRDDLETAVRPRRPVATQGAARPDARRPAPLKLVAEQRIDTPQREGPVRPRRVKVTQTLVHNEAPKGSADFAEYVETVGAQNLGEVLEAAASYMAFVEGQDAFSRPQLMSKLSGTEHADTSREDRLRSFGQLLRAGKIRKLGGGRFEASEDISYRPNTRAAGA